MTPRPTPSPGVTILTLSFAGDLARCRLLCETTDRFVGPETAHWLAVPAADLTLFASMAGGRRRLIAQEDLLPGWLRKIPLPSPAWRARLRLPRRNVYLSLRGRPVRGWIAQQMMKLAAAARVETDELLHCDSDTVFVRPFAAGGLRRGGATRLLRRPGAGRTAMHAPWHQAASRLLGLAPSDYHEADYIDQFVTWRRPAVVALLDRIATVTSRDPFAALAAAPDLSEYILYGVFCDKVLGIAAAGHAEIAESLCETLWSRPDEGSAGLPPPAVGPHHVGLGIQSTIPVTDAAYRALVEDTIRLAADQDRVAAGEA